MRLETSNKSPIPASQPDGGLVSIRVDFSMARVSGLTRGGMVDRFIPESRRSTFPYFSFGGLTR